MERIAIAPRPDWEKKMQEQGFLFYNDDEYYNESAAYVFSESEVDTIATATREIYNMCLAVVDYVIEHQLFEEFMIPVRYADWISWSWRERKPSVYGRFDFAYNNRNLKLLEFNADTPTLLLESSVIQWNWLQDFNPDFDQFNKIHEMLTEHFAYIKNNLLPGKLYFTASFNLEDFMTLKYLQDAAAQAGIETEYIDIEDIAVDENSRFIDNNGKHIKNIFKIYPYEWLFNEPFGELLPQNQDSCYWLEPPFKAILSNKMLLHYLYVLFPDSPYILPAHFVKPGGAVPNLTSYAKKPVFSREGENVTLVSGGTVIEATDGEYGAEGYIFQQYAELPEFDGWHPIIGSWVIGGKPAGIGIRESRGRVTNVTSRFCSHYIKK
jgi:glutathionylspermidine synthase